jgi:polysaccharide pyruvyl transferase WcaK-like protein
MIHHVFANKSNIGDWLSALAIQSLLAPLKVKEYFCDEPFVDETLKKLSTVSQDDLIIIGGGGLFMDYFTPFWEGFREMADRIPYCIWGVGYCDLKREPSLAPKALLEDIVFKSRFCIVRDELSRRHLSRCALPQPVPCPSICVVEKPLQMGYGLLHVDNYSTAGADVYEAMDAYGKEFAKDTRRSYVRTNNRIQSGSEAALTYTLKLYDRSDIVLSSALHGCIFAVAMGRKILAVSGDYKIESFMQAVGLSEWVCDFSEVDSVPELLTNLSDQTLSHDFTEWARQENRKIAQKVLRSCGAV